MGLITFVGRVVLVVLNIIFLTVALALVVGGFILRFGHKIFQGTVDDILKQLESAANNVYGSGVSTDAFELGTAVSGLAVTMIIVGFVLLAFSFAGCCGACYNIKSLALMYAVVLGILLLIQVILIIFVFGGPDVLKKGLSKGLKASMNQYSGLKGTDTTTIVWNFAMRQFKCCGADGYADFADKGTWKTNDMTLSSGTVNVLTPVACCKELPAGLSDTKKCAGDSTDVAYDNIDEIKDASNYDKGCVDAIWEKVVTLQTDKYGPVIAICWLCQIAMILFAVLVYKDK
ncbi:CD63 antigen-like [Dreissena polymorpha]|uniref:Tetraspanin n=1 Tax=Dreissena polymorpha TaxID=45954 RepID=A0A9D4BP79_DREPO|nr:CD63 antigen-like [Dreissena polymorpha]KAH3700277.1 hypothetical protein DPMN_075251 [Dreissena polymorpha]